MKKLIDKIRKVQTWRERVDIARDELPGTPFDYIIEAVLSTKRWEKCAPHMARTEYECLGKWLALKILQGETQLLHDLAKAVAVLKRHKSQPDYDLIALFSMSGMFPPGWEKTWGTDATGKLAPGFKRIPKSARVIIAMRDIKRSIEQKLNRKLTDAEWQRRRKRIQRYSKEFNIPLDDTPSSRP
jgi:hypothetical protein